MRTSGNHSDASLTIVPALLLMLMLIALVGGVDDTLRNIDQFCRTATTTVVSWLKAL